MLRGRRRRRRRRPRRRRPGRFALLPRESRANELGGERGRVGGGDQRLARGFDVSALVAEHARATGIFREGIRRVRRRLRRRRRGVLHPHELQARTTTRSTPRLDGVLGDRLRRDRLRRDRVRLGFVGAPMFGEVSDAIPLPSSFPLRRGERGRVLHVLEPFRRGRGTARRRRHRRPSLRLGGVSVDRRAATATTAADDPTDESPRRLKHRAQDSRGGCRRRRRRRVRLRALRITLPRARLPVGLLVLVFARLGLERAARRHRPPRGGSLDGGGGGAGRGEDAGGFPRAALASSRPGRKRDRAKLLQRGGGAPSRRVSIIVRGRLRLRGRDGGLRLRGRDGGLRLRGRDSRGASCVASTHGSRRVGRRGPRGVTRHLRVGRRGRSGGGEAAEVARLRVAHGLGGARGVVV